ncbi:S-layer family protein [Salsuginibacillus halophilus]|uniref:S-layer family protein n=1 Tax=Salsuginibacillus halophilus TaxID=517424 RepID=A0A2P8HQC9_9BACI|nr:S-layer homology domain-containing protein [Salsuginibacillus halophilus]PSL48415.1 S-layer family protein [Salsuginibacillus halophilus]
MKKLIGAGVAGALMFSVSSTAQAAFDDVSSTHWAKSSIEQMVEKEIINGYPDGTYRPDASIQRQHVAAILNRGLELDGTNEALPADLGINSSHPHYNDIQAVYSSGIMQGTNEGFEPEAEFTRAQMTEVLTNAFDLEAQASTSFDDLSEQHWGYDSAQAAVSAGLASGYEDNTFRPNNPTTRAQMAAFLISALDYQDHDSLSVTVEGEEVEAVSHHGESYILVSDMEKMGYDVNTTDAGAEVDRGDLTAAFEAGVPRTVFDNEGGMTFDEAPIEADGELALHTDVIDLVFGADVETGTDELTIEAAGYEEEEVDWWGRPYRTSDDLSNEEFFPWLLEHVPADFYESPERNVDEGLFQTASEFYGEHEGDQVTKENVSLWLERVRTYYNNILNVDYRTIDESWAEETLEQVTTGEIDDQIYDYVDWVKENEIVIEGWFEPEPTFIYRDASQHMRGAFDFEIKEYNEREDVLFDIYDQAMIDGEWQDLGQGRYQGYSDIRIGSSIGGNWGPTWGVIGPSITFHWSYR